VGSPSSAPVGAATKVSISCAAQRQGSGLRGLNADAFDPATMTALATLLETASSDAYTGDQPIPPGVQDIAVSLSTTVPHDPTVSSSFYRCGIHLR
jgi:hypothetical protein